MPDNRENTLPDKVSPSTRKSIARIREIIAQIEGRSGSPTIDLTPDAISEIVINPSPADIFKTRLVPKGIEESLRDESQRDTSKSHLRIVSLTKRLMEDETGTVTLGTKSAVETEEVKGNSDSTFVLAVHQERLKKKKAA